MWRALLLVAVVLLAVACGPGGDAATIVARAQDGFRRLGSTPVRLHVSVQTPIPVKRTYDLDASQLPKLELTRWAKHPHRIACGPRLDCARADVDIAAALKAFGPLLPSLPIDPKDVRSATLDLAVDQGGRTRYLHIHGEARVALLGDVPFDADLDVPR